jgi:hypothetical protein
VLQDPSSSGSTGSESISDCGGSYLLKKSVKALWQRCVGSESERCAMFIKEARLAMPGLSTSWTLTESDVVSVRPLLAARLPVHILCCVSTCVAPVADVEVAAAVATASGGGDHACGGGRACGGDRAYVVVALLVALVVVSAVVAAVEQVAKVHWESV